MALCSGQRNGNPCTKAVLIDGMLCSTCYDAEQLPKRILKALERGPLYIPFLTLAFSSSDRVTRAAIADLKEAGRVEVADDVGPDTVRLIGGTGRWEARSLKDDGPRRKYARYEIVSPDGKHERIFRGKFASSDASNEAARRNKRLA